MYAFSLAYIHSYSQPWTDKQESTNSTTPTAATSSSLPIHRGSLATLPCVSVCSIFHWVLATRLRCWHKNLQPECQEQHYCTRVCWRTGEHSQPCAKRAVQRQIRVRATRYVEPEKAHTQDQFTPFLPALEGQPSEPEKLDRRCPNARPTSTGFY